MTDLSELKIAGRVALPGDGDWDEARLAWNLTADQHPTAVALVESAEDVAATVRFAAANGLRVTAQGTGHGAASMPDLAGTVLIKTAAMRGVEVDPASRTARVEAGVQGAELAAAAQEHGLAFLPGSAPDVGVVGYSVGGGISWLSRKHGFACNSVRAFEVVTAEGETRTVGADDGDDLFWALRGGGGGYAIVTAMTVGLVEVGELFAGAVVYPAEVGADAVRAYRDWARSAPEEVSSILRFLTPPPIPDVPEPLRGRALLTIDGTALVGSREEGEALWAPMRELGEPIMDTFEWMPASGLGGIHMDPENPVPGIGEGGLVGELSDEALDAFLGLAGPDSGSPLLLTEIRHLGGAMAREAGGGGALAKLDAEFVMYSVGMPATPELAEAIPGYLRKIGETMKPFAAEGAYFNFTEAPCDVDAILPADVCDRLREVKRAWDPEGRIVANHGVGLEG